MNFFFIEPLYTLRIDNPAYWLNLLMLVAVGVLISTLMVRIRGQADLARLRERRAAGLYALSRELAAHRAVGELAHLARQHVGALFDADVFVLLPDAENKVHRPNRSPPACPSPPPWPSRTWPWPNGCSSTVSRPGGHRHAAGGPALFLPLATARGVWACWACARTGRSACCRPTSSSC